MSLFYLRFFSFSFSFFFFPFFSIMYWREKSCVELHGRRKEKRKILSSLHIGIYCVVNIFGVFFKDVLQTSYCFFYRQNRWPGHKSETVFHELPQGQARVEGTTIQTNQRCKVYLQNNKFCDNNANWMSFQWKWLKSSNQKIWVNRHACIIITILHKITVNTCIWSCQYFCYCIVQVPSITCTY